MLRRPNESLTFGALDARANRLAHVLDNRGIGRDAVVGIMVERSTALVIALAGVIKAGQRICHWTQRTPKSGWRSWSPTHGRMR